MERTPQNGFKKNFKKISLFLLIVIPLLCLVGFLLYSFVPSLENMQYVVIMIMIAIGGIVYLIMDYVSRKIEEKKKNKPKKYDPFAD